MITVTRSPLEFSPAGNPIVYTLSGDSSNLVFFKVTLIEPISQTIFYSGNIYPRPVNPTVASINFSSHLSSVVDVDVDNLDVLTIEKPSNTISYQIVASEWGISNGLLVQLSNDVTYDVNVAFDAELDVLNYNTRFTGSTYVADSGATYQAKFLTLQPDGKPTTDSSLEQLYLLNNNNDEMILSVTVSGVTFDVPVTGNTKSYNDVLAKGYLAITGTGITYDSIIVYADGQQLGHYVNSSSGNSINTIASALAAELSGNTLGYGISVSGNTIEITAPINSPNAGNNIVLSAAFYPIPENTTGGTQSSAIISGYTDAYVADDSVDTITGVYDPFTYTTVTSFPKVIDTTGHTISGFTAELVNQINLNTFNDGMSAVQIADDAFQYIAPSGTGNQYQGYAAIFTYHNSVYWWGYGFITSYFDEGSSPYGVIPHSVTGFTGGVYHFGLGNLIRINTSPKKLKKNAVSGFTYGADYSVVVKNSTGGTITETKTYQYLEEDCNVELMNVLFTNSFGGVDCYQFLNPQESIQTNKLTVTKNNLNLDDPDNIYITDGTYNTIEKVYNSRSKSTVKVFTQPMTDAESRWLAELVNSKNIYVEMTDGSIVPVQLVSTNYSVQVKKYLREQNQFQFEFNFPENFLPSTSNNSIVIN